LGINVYQLLAKLPKDFSIVSDGMQLLFAVLLLALGVVVAVKAIRTLFFAGTTSEPAA
jgi:cell division protein FtsL